MNNILLTAFKNTSSEKLLKYFREDYTKLILANDKQKSEKQLEKAFVRSNFDFIISFGQRPNIKDKVHIETQAKCGKEIIVTAFNCDSLLDSFKKSGIDGKLSYNAGTSFCNHIYFFGLDYLRTNASECKMIFVHLPFEKNIDDLPTFAEKTEKALIQFRSKVNN